MKNKDYILVDDFQFIIDVFEGRIKTYHPSQAYTDSYLKVMNFLAFQALNKLHKSK